MQEQVRVTDEVEQPAVLKGEAALSVEHVSHAFGSRRVLHDVSLRVGQGRFCALLGLNGAGKSTLFSLITRLYNNRSGRIAVLGYDVRRQSAEALRRLGVVFQNRTLDLELSISQNFAYHAALHGMLLREGTIVASGPLGEVMTADNLTKTFGMALRVDRFGDRFTARAA